MFKKFLAIATAVVLGAGISLVAVASPASAHKPTVTIDCDGINYKFVSYGSGTSNTFTVYVDDMVTPAFTKSFGNNVNPSEKFSWDGTVAHNVKYVINAEHNDHDFTSQIATTTPCPPDLEKKYGICHADPADTAANGWEYLNISINAIVGNEPNQNGNDGHTEHAADIIPVIPTILPNGQNLDTVYNGLTGQQILEGALPCVLPPLGQPQATPAQCVDGKPGLGSIWVKILTGKLQYTITNDPAFPSTPAVNVPVPNNGDGYTHLPPGHYIVTVAPLNNTVIVTGQTVWPYKIEILPPVDCHQTEIPIPVSLKTDMQCEALSTIGRYTLPVTPNVEWFVGPNQKTGTQNVYVPGLVTVQARITAAAQALGIVFVGGGLTHDFPHLFTLPAQECDTTLALLVPLAVPNPGSCTAAPSYSLSNTTSSHGGVQWKIGDPQVNKTAGVHQATWGSTVKVEATLVNDVYDGFAKETKTEWEFIFPAKPTACGDLSTLALTGTTGGFVLWIAGAMLLLGGAGIYFTRRRLAAQK